MTVGEHKGINPSHTLLLIDDDPDVLESLETILSWTGYRVIAKPDAISAMAAIKEGVKVDAIVTDYWLPYMNGKDFLGGLKKIAPSIPVIVLTAASSPESCLECINLGAFAYLNKPVPMVELRRVVQTAILNGKTYETGKTLLA